jgi:acyltransferase
LEQQTSARIDYLDLLKGVGIFLVVWGHTMTPRSVWIYSFHMPLFFFLSGIVHKNKPWKDFFLGKLNRLYIPYAIFSFLSWLFYLGLIICQEKPAQLQNHLPKIMSVLNGIANNGGNDSIWYLTCLLLVGIFYWFLRRFLPDPRLLPITIVCSSLIGYRLGILRITLPFKAEVAFTGLVFYYLGHLSLETGLLQKVNKIKPTLLVIFILIAIPLQVFLARLNVAISPGISKVALISNRLGNYFLFYAAALLAIFYLILIAQRIGYSKVWNYLGQNSLLILAVHKPLFSLFQLIFGPRVTSHWLYGITASIAVLLISLPLIKLSNRYLPFLVGKKPLLKYKTA